MKKLVSASLTLSVVVVLGLAQTSAAQAPTQDSVVGSGSSSFFGPFDIDVRSGPSGENPTGNASFQSAVGLLAGPPSCLAVRGNVATFNMSGTSFGLVTFQVVDNAATNELDTIDGIPTARAPSDCSPLTGGVRGTVAPGDIVVVDAPPSPTSKDQCKRGGWQSYGVFRNQGDCVSFVARQRPRGR